MDDSTADTTVTTSAGSIEASSSTKMDIEDNENQEFCDAALNNEIQNSVRNHLPSECVPSSSTNINLENNGNKLIDQNFKSNENTISLDTPSTDGIF